jgi:hypothetical protein
MGPGLGNDAVVLQSLFDKVYGLCERQELSNRPIPVHTVMMIPRFTATTRLQDTRGWLAPIMAFSEGLNRYI